MNTAIYTAPITSAGRSDRREAEVRATKSLIKEVFGADDRMSHHADGAPYLASRPEVCISVSHCVDECVLAVCDETIGVDIETARPTLQRIASKFLTAAEQARGPHSLHTLMQMWSAKEAIFKCARIPTLVVSAIELSPDLTTATVTDSATTRHFILTYPRLTHDRVIALALEKITDLPTPKK